MNDRILKFCKHFIYKNFVTNFNLDLWDSQDEFVIQTLKGICDIIWEKEKFQILHENFLYKC